MKKEERTKQLIMDKSRPNFSSICVTATLFSNILNAIKLRKEILSGHFQNNEAI